MYKMEDYSDGIFELQSANYADGTELDEKELEELEGTQELIDWVMIDFVSESAVQEDAGEEQASQKLAQHFQEIANEYKASGDTSDEYEEMQDIATAFRTKGIQAGIDEINDSRFEFSSDPFGRQEYELEPADKDVVDLLRQAGYTHKIVKDPNATFHTFNRKVVLQKIGKEVSEDSGELARLKELSGLEEDNGKKTVWYTITPGSEKEKGMMQAEIDQGGKITNILAATPEDLANQLMKLGVTHDDYDFGHTSDVDFPEEDEGWNNKEYGNDAHGFIQDTHEILKAKSESYQPFPEADEFNIEEDEDFEEVLGSLGFPEDETELFDAEYQGRKVPLNKPMRGDSKKFKVYVKDPKTGNVKKVNFGHGGTSAKKAGQKTMKIRKSNPKARKSFRARHNCANPGPRTRARYWSCRAW
jgi:hypothetical protein